ncbi:MAG: helicase-associated domain-containing protein, partial [Chloroflexi bacterium]|nr:helicase-associated domain-containing protein [Chloroflexota bacterium]
EAYSPAPQAGVQRAFSALVDDAATLLAWLRREPGAPASTPERLSTALHPFLLLPAALPLTLSLLQECGCLRAPGLALDPGVARPFLEAARDEQLAALFKTWLVAIGWNDLHHVPGLAVEGNWHNAPAAARAAVLPILRRVPAGEWWSLDSFVAAIKEHQPDYQRPAGDYDSWYLRNALTGEYLRGFEHWERVDGALIRYWLTGPLHWLGVTDLAAGGEAFCLTTQGQALLADKPPPINEPPGRLRVYPDGRLTVDRAVSRYVRFQAARFSEWLPTGGEGYLYRLTPASLTGARAQGVHVRHVLAFLNKNAAPLLPPSLEEALTRWEKNGAEAALSDMLVLRVKSPELLKTLRRSPKTSRYLGEALSPAAVEVKRQDRESLRAALAEMGMLVEEVLR